MIPKIIHQVWEGRKEPLPDFYIRLRKTWKEHHPDWRYEFWDGDRMDSFVNSNYPQMADIFFQYRYDVQRWDVIRYLILYKTGGMYVDFDYECLESFDNYLSEEKCYFAMEPALHRRSFEKDIYFNNALIITPPGHPFIKNIITCLQNTPVTYSESKYLDVLNSTGPLMLTGLYEKYETKADIHLISSEQVSPWSKNEVIGYINGKVDKKMLEKQLENAIAIHYFWGSWIND